VINRIRLNLLGAGLRNRPQWWRQHYLILW